MPRKKDDKDEKNQAKLQQMEQRGFKPKLSKANQKLRSETTTTTTTTTTIIKDQNKLMDDEIFSKFKYDKPMELGEILFWKVFRNIYLKRTILPLIINNGKLRIGDSFTYNDIVSVQWMLNYGYIELLKSKVSKGEFLIDFFDVEHIYNLHYYDNSIPNLPTIPQKPMKSIFKEIKDDKQFYESLFKNYKQYFIENYIYENWFKLNETHLNSLIPGSRIPYRMSGYTAGISMKHDNLDAFSILVNSYSFNPLTDMFYDTINYGSFKVAKFIYKHLKLSKNDNVGKVWKNCTFVKSSIGEEQPKHFKLLVKLVDFLIYDLKFIPPKEMNKVKEDIFQVDLKSITVGELLDICITISTLLEHTNLFDDYLKSISKKEARDKYMGYKCQLQTYLPDPSTDFISRNELIQIKSNYSTGSGDGNIDILSNTVESISSENEIVELLFKMALTFTNYSTNFKDNFIFFKSKYLNDHSLNSIHKVNYLYPIEFGSFNDIFNFPDQDSKYCDGKTTVLFKHIQENKELQLQFIQKSIDNINQSSIHDIPIIKPITLITMLLNIDRLDLIEMVVNQTSGKLSEIELVPNSLIDLIKSTSTFDYFYQQFNNNSKHFTIEKCFKNNQSIQLMKHIKSNHKELYSNFLASTTSDLYEILSDKPYDYSMESLIFIYENISDFRLCYSRIDIWTRWNYFEFTLDQFIHLVKYTPTHEKYSYHCGSTKDYSELYSIITNNSTNWYGQSDTNITLFWSDTHNYYKSKSTLQQLHWVKTNRPMDLQSKRCNPLYGHETENVVTLRDIEVLSSIYDYYTGKFNANAISNFMSLAAVYLPSSAQVYRNNQLFFQIRNIIGYLGDTNKLATLFKTFTLKNYSENGTFYPVFITPLLIIAARFGRFNIFQYLKINQPWIFNAYLNYDNTISDIFDTRRSNTYINSCFNQIIQTAKSYNNINLLFLIRNDIFKEHLETLKYK